MRKIALLILCLFCCCNVEAQKDVESLVFKKLKDSLVCFNCGNGKSKPVLKTTKLIQNRKYSKIKKQMLSNNVAEKFLAAITCKKLFALKRVSLSYDEEKLIEKIFNSKDLLYTYSDDAYMEARPIRNYIYNDEDKWILNQTEIWLEIVLK